MKLGRVIEGTYGKGGFYRLAELIDALAANKKGHTLTLFDNPSDIPEYERLLEFLSKPARKAANL